MSKHKVYGKVHENTFNDFTYREKLAAVMEIIYITLTNLFVIEDLKKQNVGDLHKVVVYNYFKQSMMCLCASYDISEEIKHFIFDNYQRLLKEFRIAFYKIRLNRFLKNYKKTELAVY